MVPAVAAHPRLPRVEVGHPDEHHAPGRSHPAARSTAAPGASRCSSTCQKHTASSDSGGDHGVLPAGALERHARPRRRLHAAPRRLDAARRVPGPSRPGHEPPPARADVEHRRARRQERLQQGAAAGGRSARARVRPGAPGAGRRRVGAGLVGVGRRRAQRHRAPAGGAARQREHAGQRRVRRGDRPPRRKRPAAGRAGQAPDTSHDSPCSFRASRNAAGSNALATESTPDRA